MQTPAPVASACRDSNASASSAHDCLRISKPCGVRTGASIIMTDASLRSDRTDFSLINVIVVKFIGIKLGSAKVT